MSGRRSRDKGKRGERAAARELSRVLGVPARRGQQFSGVEGKDVVVGLAGIHVEVKRCEKLSLYPAIEQACRDAAAGEVPLVLHRRNGKPWLVILELEQLPELARLIAAAGQRSASQPTGASQ
jgi:hypothetical protein